MPRFLASLLPTQVGGASSMTRCTPLRNSGDLLCCRALGEDCLGAGSSCPVPGLPPMLCLMLDEFLLPGTSGENSAFLQDIRHEASDFPCRVAKLPKNKNRNRYRDVSPCKYPRDRSRLTPPHYGPLGQGLVLAWQCGQRTPA